MLKISDKWNFSNKQLAAAYNYALVAHWTWEELEIFAHNELFEMDELADALALGIDAEGYDQEKDLETDSPWCCPWEWTMNESVLSIEDFSEKYSPEIERLIKEERAEREEDEED